MKTNKLAMGIVLAAASLLSVNAFAEDDPFKDWATVKMMDTDKDGMVSKAEYLAMMGKLFDMKAKAMNAKGMKMTQEQIDMMIKDLFHR